MFVLQLTGGTGQMAIIRIDSLQWVSESTDIFTDMIIK